MTSRLPLIFALTLASASVASAQETQPLQVPDVGVTAPQVATPALETPDDSPAPPEPASASAPVTSQSTPEQPLTVDTTAAVSADPVSDAADTSVADQETAQGTATETAQDEGAETAPAAVELPPVEPLSQQEELVMMAQDATDKAMEFLRNGGPSIWAIASLAVITLSLILWKIWRLALIGAWSRGKAGRAVATYEEGKPEAALTIVESRMGIRSKVVVAGLTALRDLPQDRAREETARVAKKHLAQASTGLGALELIATIAPLLGLLGTVLGMIAAFQALQQAGSKADLARLAGGIWDALLTTAAGMAVAIPASVALTWFEAVITRIRQDIEDNATRLFVAEPAPELKIAAE